MPPACSRTKRSKRPGQRASEPQPHAAGFRKPLPEARAPCPAGTASGAEAGPGGRALPAGSPHWLSWSLAEATRSCSPLPGHLLEASGDQVPAPHWCIQAEMCSHLATHTGWGCAARLALFVSARAGWGRNPFASRELCRAPAAPPSPTGGLDGPPGRGWGSPSRARSRSSLMFSLPSWAEQGVNIWILL